MHREPERLAAVPEKEQHEHHGDQQQQDNEVVHVLPLVVVSELRGQRDRELSPGEYDRIEIGVEFAADIGRAEQRLDHVNHFDHRESFQYADPETAYDHDIHLRGLRTDETEQCLQQQVDQQYGFGRDGLPHVRYQRIGDRDPGCCGVIGHADVLAQHSERRGDFDRVARIGAVDQDYGQHNHERSENSQPSGNPRADRDAERCGCHGGISGF